MAETFAETAVLRCGTAETEAFFFVQAHQAKEYGN